MQKKRRFLVAGLVSVLLLLAAGIAYYQYEKPRTSVANSTTEIVIAADSLFREFTKNESLATSMYGNKVIEVKGIVHDLDSGSGSLAVLLTTGSSGFINCAMAKTSKAIYKTNEVTIKGKCTGFMMDVLLVDCDVQ